jgi:hypothetical protein
MDLEKLEKLSLIVLYQKSTSSSPHFNYNVEFATSFWNLMNVASQALPDHNMLFSQAIKQVVYIEDAKTVIRHLLKIIEIEKESKVLIKDLKIFDSADEKMKQANLCFQNEDYSSALHSLNTALELVLKDKVGIPTTITNINTSNVIDILAKYKIEPYLYLLEARKYVLTVDNKIKHTGYSPSKVDCINGMKAMEGLISKLRSMNIVLSEEQRNKIFDEI